MLFIYNLPICQLFVYEPLKNYPNLFNICITQKPAFKANMTNTCCSKANQLELFVFLTICGSKMNNYLTLLHVTWIAQIKIWLITCKWQNIIWYSAKCYSIFASPTIWLKFQTFAISLEEESRSGTPLCRNLVPTLEINAHSRSGIQIEWSSQMSNGVYVVLNMK